jgi:molybdopterin-containing oxidoreductase family membrane subunit
MVVAYAYVNEAFYAWYSGSLYEQFMLQNRQTGPFGPMYWMLIGINLCMIQLFWFRRIRDSIPVLFILSLLVNVGMWLERFVIIAVSLHRDFLPSSWEGYEPTKWDFGMFTGTIGLFMSLFFLFVRLLPAISIFEVRTLVPDAKLKTAEHHG